MKMVKAALVAAMLLPASGAFAQDTNMERMQMQVGLSMLEVNAQNALQRLNIDGDVRELTLSQLAQIAGILSDPDADSGGSSTKASIEAVLR